MGLGGFFKGLPVVGNLFEDDNPEEKYQRELDAKRAESKKAQLGYVDQMRGPQVTESNRRRLAALEQDAADKPLVSDPYFQGQRALAVQGGQQALSNVQNKQRALGVSGGFSNVGSTQDAYDRLSGQLAQLGGQAMEHRSQARDQAADLEQGWNDREIDDFNNRLKLKMGIEQGDFESAMDSLKQIYGMQEAGRTRNANTRGQIASGLLSAFGPDAVKKKAAS